MRASSREEIEVKLPVDDPQSAWKRFCELGARVITPRSLERNWVYDRPGLELREAGRLLRLRHFGPVWLATFKEPADGAPAFKVRRETELVVPDPAAFHRMLTGLGFSVAYRYEKYRSLWEWGSLHLCLDETPLGSFLELEGPGEAIHEAARRLGYTEDAYIRETYRDLHERRAREEGRAPGDLVFSDRFPATPEDVPRP